MPPRHSIDPCVPVSEPLFRIFSSVHSIRPNQVLRLLLAFLFVALFGVEPAWSQLGPESNNDWPAGVAPRQRLGTERAIDYDFSNISVNTLQTWLGRIGISIPVNLDGNLSGWVWAQRSADGWFDFRNYRVEGEIRSPELKIEDWFVRNATVRFGYARGNWYIGNISGEVRSTASKSPIGQAKARARILAATNSFVELNASVDAIDLRALLQAFGIDVEVSSSGGSVAIAGTIPTATPSDLSTWKAIARVEISDFILPWIESSGSAFASLKLADSNWQIGEAQIKVAEQDLKIAGMGTLNAKLPFELTLEGNNIDARQLAQQLKDPELASQLRGNIRLAAKVSGNQPKGVERAEATIESEMIGFRSQPIENLNVTAAYTTAGLQVVINSAELAGGTVSGEAKWRDLTEISRGVPSEVVVQIDSLALEKLKLVDLPVTLGGQASGNLQFGLDHQPDFVAWHSEGQLLVSNLSVAGTGVGNARLDWQKTSLSNQLTSRVSLRQGDGVFKSEIEANFEDQPGKAIRGTAFCGYRADGQLEDYDLVARVGSLPSGRIPVRANGKFKLSGSPNIWLEQGEFKLVDTIASVADRMIRLQFADVSVNESEYRIERFRLLDIDGRVAGAAILRRDNIGQHLLRLRIVDLQLNSFIKPFAPMTLSRLDGLLTTELELRKDATSNQLQRGWIGDLRGSLSSLTYENKRLGELNLSGEITDQTVTATIDGQLAGGSTNATLECPLAILDQGSSTDSTPARFKINVSKIQAKRLSEILLGPKFTKNVTGSASIELTAEAFTSNELVLSGSLAVPRTTWNGASLVRNLSARVRYANSKLTVDRVSGGFAGGRIDAQGQLDVDVATADLKRGRINFVAQRIDASNLVALFAPEYASYFQGALNYRGVATCDRTIHVKGSAEAKSGSLFGVPVQIARGELRVRFSKSGDFIQAISNDVHGICVGGKLNATIDIRKGTEYSLQSKGRLSRGKLDQLAKSFGFDRIVGSGTFDGIFDLRSNQLELIRALVGQIQMDFQRGDVNSLPLLSNIDRFVPLVQFSSTDFEDGRFNARIGQGQLRISDLVINSKAFLLAANGNAAVDGSKLDLSVVVQTGGSSQQQLTRAGLDLLLVGPVPQIAAISQLNELLRNRSVFLHVGGSASRPVIQANAAQSVIKAFVENLGRNNLNAPLRIGR
jgi:hypothetical protein